MTTTTSDHHEAREPTGGTSTFDLDEYLRRIGVDGPVRADLPTLVALHRAQIATVPFENLDVMLGAGIALDLGAVTRKLVDDRRGGYCHEQNLLLCAALTRIGFRTHLRLVRTGDPDLEPGPRDHLVVEVDLDDERWLADVGFGSGPLEPLPLRGGISVQQGGWRFRTTTGPDGSVRVQQPRDGRWETSYTITDEALAWTDVEEANRDASTSPGSPFVRRPIVVRRTDQEERRLVGRKLSVIDPEGATTTRLVPDEAYGPTLHAEFGLDLPAHQVQRLVHTLDATTHDTE